MGSTAWPIGTTAAEQLYFDGAHVAHVVLYYDVLRRARLATVLGSGRRRQTVLTRA